MQLLNDKYFHFKEFPNLGPLILSKVKTLTFPDFAYHSASTSGCDSGPSG
jgi:hypothetical protein